MVSTQLFAQFLGIFWTVMGIGMLANKEWMNQLMAEIQKSAGIQVLAAVIPLLIGTFIVVFHAHDVENGWHIFICILGWLTLLGWIFRFWFHSVLLGMLKKHAHNFATIGGGTITIIGLILLYGGFWA